MKPDQQPFQPQQDQPEPIDWERFRAETAAKAMQSLLIGEYIWKKNYQGSSYCEKPSRDINESDCLSRDLCMASIKVADELVKQLRGKKESQDA